MAGIYEKIKCKKRRTNTFIPTPYQSSVIDYFTNRSTFKGLLLYHKLGAGKTCTSVLIADEMIRREQVQKVYILTPGSLRVNWIDEYCKKCGAQFITNNFVFMTYNSNLQLKLHEYDFNNSLIIIDEAHNLINGVKNMSKNAFATYKKIYESNCRVLLLTGTPIIQYTWEWSLLGNLLNPKTFMNIMDVDKNSIIPDKFLVSYKQKDREDEMYKGIVSYYPGDPTLYPTINYREPIKCEMLPDQFINLEEQMITDKKLIGMGPPNIGVPDYAIKHMMYIRAVKAISSRSISNCYFSNPLIQKYTLLSETLPKKLDKIISDCIDELKIISDLNRDTKVSALKKKAYLAKIRASEIEKEITSIKFQMFRRGLQNNTENEFTFQLKEKQRDLMLENSTISKYVKKLSEKYAIYINFQSDTSEEGDAGEDDGETKDDGDIKESDNIYIKFGTNWIDDDLFFSNYENILINLSRKYVALITNIASRINTKHVIFSFFKTGIGFESIGKLLKRANITYAVFSGDIDDNERRRVIEVFNSPENREGKIMNVLLVTEAGAEGISLLETNNIHILESSTKEHKITQAIGRVARIYSHSKLPKIRQYVNVWRYWSTATKKEHFGPEWDNIQKPSDNFICIDEALYKKGVEAEVAKNQFLEEKLIANAIENTLPKVMPPMPRSFANKLGKNKITTNFQDIKFRDVDVLSKPNIYAFLPMTTATSVFPTISVEFMNAHGLPLPERTNIGNNWASLETRNQAGTYEVLRAQDGANVILAYIQRTLRAPSKTSTDPVGDEPETFTNRIENVQNILEDLIPNLPEGSTLMFPRTLGGTATEPDVMELMHEVVNYISTQNPQIRFVFYR